MKDKYLSPGDRYAADAMKRSSEASPAQTPIEEALSEPGLIRRGHLVGLKALRNTPTEESEPEPSDKSTNETK